MCVCVCMRAHESMHVPRPIIGYANPQVSSHWHTPTHSKQGPNQTRTNARAQPSKFIYKCGQLIVLAIWAAALFGNAYPFEADRIEFAPAQLVHRYVQFSCLLNTIKPRHDRLTFFYSSREKWRVFWLYNRTEPIWRIGRGIKIIWHSACLLAPRLDFTFGHLVVPADN